VSAAAALSLTSGVSVDEVVDSYWIFLARNHFDVHLDRFKQRLDSDTKAAEAEAVVFSLLWNAKARPDIFEDISKGGPDFSCEPFKQEKFLVEVTSLDSSAVTRRSSLPDRLEEGGGGAFGLITAALQRAAVGKASQLANHPYPRVLAITSSHAFASILMDAHAAENLLLSDTMISYRIGNFSDPGRQITDLRRSVFFRTDRSGTRIVPCRRSISAILLVSISWGQADVVGILHPEPEIVFKPGLLSQVPYLRLTSWPVGSEIKTEWHSNGERSGTFHHRRIR
jgi:hypothetical protein